MKTKTKKCIYVVHPITTSPHPEYLNSSQIRCADWWYLIDSVFGPEFRVDDSKFSTMYGYFIDTSFQSVQKEILNWGKKHKFYNEWRYSYLYMAVVLEYPVKTGILNTGFTRLWLVNNKGEVIFDEIQDESNPDYTNQGAKRIVQVGDIVECMYDRRIRLGIVCNIVYDEPEDITKQPSVVAYDLLVNRPVSGRGTLTRVNLAYPPQIEVPKELRDSFEKYYDLYKANKS